MLQLHRILKGFKLAYDIKRRKREQITISILSQFCDLLKPALSEDLDTVMFWASFTFAFFSFLPVSEFTSPPPGKAGPSLSVHDVSFTQKHREPDFNNVKIKQSKPIPFVKAHPLQSPKANLFSIFFSKKTIGL